MGIKSSKPQNYVSNMVKTLNNIIPTKPTTKAPQVIKKPGSMVINNSFLSIENNNINLLNKSFTIEFWIKTMESNNGWIFNAGNIGVGFEGSRLKYLWNGQKFRLAPESAPAIGSWVFVRICFDNNNNNLTFFINNVSTVVAIQQPLTQPSTNIIIGNNTEQSGFTGKIADFRISLDILCVSNNTIPNNKLTVSDKTALLIAPTDNTIIDITNKNKITNMAVNYDNEYPLSIEGFENNYSHKNIKVICYILLMIIIAIVLWMSFKNTDITLSSTSSDVFQRPL